MQASDDIRSKGRLCAVIVVALGVTSMSGVVAAQSPQPETPSLDSATTTPSWLDLPPLPVVPKGLPPDAAELCGDKPGGPAWIDRMQAGLYRTMCLSAARFDGFFGNARFDDEYQATRGSVSVGALWDERDQWDSSLRFRVHLRLPQLSESLSAFVGRLDTDEYVTELRDDFDTLPRQFARDEDDAVLIGLGYRQPSRRGGHFDASIGSRLVPPEPYVKGSYRLALPFLERNLLRLNGTIFWKEDEHLGATTRCDLERLLAESLLARWTGSATFSQETEGVRWFSSLTLYQNLGKSRAFAYQAEILGESDHEVEVADYGLRAIYRRRLHRDWLFLELRSSITWPRETLLERREANWGAGVAVEMLFGERSAK